jgi:Cu(I)/Ag(I) efflux system membrane fusion protein
MKKLYGIVIITLVLGACGQGMDHSSMKHGEEAVNSKSAKGLKLFHCPMHPTYTSEGEGDCAICGMSLVPIEVQDRGGAESGVPGQSRVKINARRRQLIGLKTEAVEVRPLIKIIRTVGRVAYDPELYRTQEEYLTALGTYRRLQNGGTPDSQARAKSLLSSSRLRLKLLGLSGNQIDALASRGKPELALLLAQGKGSRSWLYAEIYEGDLGSVRVGQSVEAVSASMADVRFSGFVKAIDPTINPKSRSVRIRVQLEDPEGRLRPDMYLNARIHIDLGTRLSIPKDAIVDTGVRRIVFVDTNQDGYIEPREVVLGVRAEDYVEVREGVDEEERVVTSANFLIDSESKLRSALAVISAGHQH